MWLTEVCYIGHVTWKSVLYGKYKMGGMFDPPTQNIIQYVMLAFLASTDAQKRFFMQNHVRGIVLNYQHIFSEQNVFRLRVGG